MRKWFLLSLFISTNTTLLSQCRDTIASFVVQPVDPLRSMYIHNLSTNNNTFDCVAGVSYSGQDDGALLASFSSGNLPLFSKEYHKNLADISFRNSLKLANGNRIIGGYVSSSNGSGQSDIYILSILPNGNVLWQKGFNFQLAATTNPPDILFNSIKEGPDGSIYLLFNGQFGAAGYRQPLSAIVKLNAGNGQTVWQKVFHGGYGGGYDINIRNIEFLNNRLIAQGTYLNLSFPRESGSCMGEGLLLLDINPASGNLIRYRALCYDTAYRRKRNLPAFTIPPGGIGGRNGGSLPSTQYNGTVCTFLTGFGTQVPNGNLYHYYSPFFTKLNIYNSIDSIRLMQFAADTGLYAKDYFESITVNANNDILATGVHDLYGTPKRYKGFFSQDGTLHREELYGISYPPLEIESINLNRVIYLPGSKQAKLVFQTITRQFVIYDGDEQLAIQDTCTTQQPIAENSFTPFPYTDVAISFIAVDNMVIEKFPGIITVSDFPLTTQKICESISICDSIQIQAPAGNLCTGNNYTFKAKKSASCKRPVAWNIDTTVSKIILATDTSLTISFSKPRKGFVYAGITGCTLKDSVFVVAYEPAPPVSLGNDTILCPGKSLKISPSFSYKTYRWSTGSSDSFIIVTIPGCYTIIATDSCDNISTDTIIIKKPLLDLYAGNDVIIFVKVILCS